MPRAARRSSKPIRRIRTSVSRLRRRDRRPARARAWAARRGSCMITFTSIDQSIAARRRRDRPERHRGHAGAPRGARRRRFPTTSSAKSSACGPRTPRGSARSPICAAARSRTLGGTIAYDILLRAERDHGIEAVSYDDDVHPYSDLVLGRVDAVLLDNVLAERRQRVVPGFTVQPSAVAVGHYVGVLAPTQRGRCATRATRSCAARCATDRSSASSASGTSGTTTSPQLYARLLAGEPVAPVVGLDDAPAAAADAVDASEAARALPAVARSARRSSRSCCRACRWRWPSRSAF